MAHVNPTPEAVAEKVPETRRKFQEKYAANDYDPRDVKRFMDDDRYVRCFLRTLKSKGNVDKALEVVDTSFKFRKQIGINDLKAESFPAQMTERKGMYYKGVDNKGSPILYINTKENTASGAEETALLKKYIAWNFENHHRENPEQMCVVLLDMGGAGTGNVSIDITKYIIKSFTDYFPAYLAYMLNYEMPTLLSATWTVISAFLNAEQKQKMIMCTKKDINKYVDNEHLWDHMKK